MENDATARAVPTQKTIRPAARRPAASAAPEPSETHGGVVHCAAALGSAGGVGGVLVHVIEILPNAASDRSLMASAYSK